MIKLIKMMTLLMFIGIKAEVIQVVSKDQNGNNLNEIFLLQNDNKIYACPPIYGFDETKPLRQDRLTNIKTVWNGGMKILKLGCPLIEGNKKLFPAVVRASGFGGLFGRTDIAEIEVYDSGTVHFKVISTFGHRTETHKIAYLQYGNTGAKVIVSGSSAPTIKFSSKDSYINQTEWQDCYLIDVVGNRIYFLIRHPALNEWYVDFKEITKAEDIKKKPDLKTADEVKRILSLVPLCEFRDYVLKDNSRVILNSRVPGKVTFLYSGNQKNTQLVEWNNVDLFFAGSSLETDERLTLLIFQKHGHPELDFIENFSFEDVLKSVGFREIMSKNWDKIKSMDDDQWVKLYKHEQQKFIAWQETFKNRILPIAERYNRAEGFKEKKEIEDMILHLLKEMEVEFHESVLYDMERLIFTLKIHFHRQEEKINIFAKPRKEGLVILEQKMEQERETSLDRIKKLVGSLYYYEDENEDYKKIVLFNLKNAPIVSINKTIEHKNIILFLQRLFNPQYSNKKYLFVETHGLITKDTI